MRQLRLRWPGLLAEIYWLSAALLVLLSGPAWAELDEGIAAWERGDYAVALRELRPLAEKGHATAQLIVGAVYTSGEGVPKDYKEAVKWFRRSAEQGNAGAQFSLGLMYFEGQGVPQDNREATNWFRRAAEQGQKDAQAMFGAMYTSGERVPKDDREAFKWYRLAAEQGMELAQYSLGLMYAKGRGLRGTLCRPISGSALRRSKGMVMLERSGTL